MFCPVWKVLLSWESTRICWIMCTVQKNKTKKQQRGVPLSNHLCAHLSCRCQTCPPVTTGSHSPAGPAQRTPGGLVSAAEPERSAACPTDPETPVSCWSSPLIWRTTEQTALGSNRCVISSERRIYGSTRSCTSLLCCPDSLKSWGWRSAPLLMKSRHKLDWLFKTFIVSMNALIRSWIMNHYAHLSCHR